MDDFLNKLFEDEEFRNKILKLWEEKREDLNVRLRDCNKTESNYYTFRDFER